MKLGVYSQADADTVDTDSDDVYVQKALYDFDAGEWDADSDGVFVSKASASPSPEELKIRFDRESRRTFVCTPERLLDNGYEIVVPDDQTWTVEEGHQKREEDGLLDTQVQKQYQKDEGVIVVDDDYEFTGKEPDSVVRRSEWDALDFAEEFDFDFYTND